MGGTEKHLVDLIDRLDPSTFDVVILTMGQDPYSALFARTDRRIRVARGPRTGRFSVARRAFRSLNPDYIVFTAGGGVGLFHWQMYLAARFSGARRVTEIKHQPASPPAGLRLSTARRAQGRDWRALKAWLALPWRRGVTLGLAGFVCDATICVSDAVRDRLIGWYGYPASKTITLRNGVDVRRFARNAVTWEVPEILSAGKGTGPVAVCVSRLVLEKRVDLLIDAMKTVALRYPGSRCVVVGGGVLEEELKARARELEMERNFLFAGETEDVRPFLAAGDIFVLPSELEGLSLALLEAMAFGLPCIAAEAGGTVEVIRDGVSGFVVPCGSAPALSDAIGRLFGDPEERVRMGKNARRIVEEEFDLEKSMARVKSAILGGE